MIKGITNSTVLIACVNESYQTSAYCMFELKKAAELKKPIIALMLQPGTDWTSSELRAICQYDKHLYCDISAVASQSSMWVTGVEPSESAFSEFKRAVKSSPTTNLLKRALSRSGQTNPCRQMQRAAYKSVL